jgi:hypothetical protein
MAPNCGGSSDHSFDQPTSHRIFVILPLSYGFGMLWFPHHRYRGRANVGRKVDVVIFAGRFNQLQFVRANSLNRFDYGLRRLLVHHFVVPGFHCPDIYQAMSNLPDHSLVSLVFWH